MEKQITNEERMKIFADLIATCVREIKYCDDRISSPLIEKCNCIIATADGFYTVGVDAEHHATVNVGEFGSPVQFTYARAKELAENFKAENGNGPLVWNIYTVKTFYAKRKDNFLDQLEMLNRLVEKYS